MPKPPKAPFVSPCGKAVHSLKDAVECHGVSYRVLFAAVRENEIPAIQAGAKWTVLCEDLLTWRRDNGSPNLAELERA